MSGETQQLSTTCCIAGGGPAGIMLGLLMARAGVDVIVLEKHADFLRDFRGDTIHPSTLEVMSELGYLEECLELPHQKVDRFNVQFGDVSLPLADFSRLANRCKYIAMMPQWNFLNFLTSKGSEFKEFALHLSSEVTDVMEEDGRVVGLRAKTEEKGLEVRAKLVIGADGRQSKVRSAAGLTVEASGAPMDVLWFRLSRKPDDPVETMARFDRGRIFIMINRADYWQCAYVIPKGSAAQLQQSGLETFKASVAAAARLTEARIGELADWDDVKLLTVRIDRLRRWWRPGLLCIGDAAHAMSPIGGVGINLAIQDAVAAANLLTKPLLSGKLSDVDLMAVERRRAWPAAMTQRLQMFMQKQIIEPFLDDSKCLEVPAMIKLLQYVPVLRRIPGYLIGVGVRPEHIAK